MMQTSYDWVISCIESSTNIFQFKCCNALVGLFEVMYKDEENSKEKIAELKAALDSQETKHSLDA